MFSLENKIAVVTGGGSGIGGAISQIFAKNGAFVHIIDTNKDTAGKIVNEIAAVGGRALHHQCDITNQEDVVMLFKKIGRIDILVNSAGIAHIGKVTTTQEEDFERVYKVNVKGTYNCIYASVPGMTEQGGGVILNMSSIAAHVGITDRFAYSMSKGAVAAMTMSVARDYLDQSIRCNSISPARVHTPFVDGFIAANFPNDQEAVFEKLSKSQPIGRMGKPVEIAALALFLCSDEAAFITGSDYPIDGGFITLNN